MSAPATPSHLLRGEFACPHCANDTLEAVSDGTQTNFLCQRCWTCWHVELGYVSPVPVLTCPGCRSEQECGRHQEERAELIDASTDGSAEPS